MKKKNQIVAYGVYPKGEKLTHYCTFYRTLKEAKGRVNEYAWCEMCGQCTGEEYEIQKVIITQM